mmetsp:Transcript_39757/g.64138  ORF Transcript_39757/g.64138 Transcript_39757/m.64138 type:complete len:452 (-) Transcript_39757:508-1863(-)
MATGFRRTLCLLLLVLDCAGTNRQVQRHLDISLSFPRDAEMTTNALGAATLFVYVAGPTEMSDAASYTVHTLVSSRASAQNTMFIKHCSKSDFVEGFVQVSMGNNYPVKGTYDVVLKLSDAYPGLSDDDSMLALRRHSLECCVPLSNIDKDGADERKQTDTHKKETSDERNDKFPKGRHPEDLLVTFSRDALLITDTQAKSELHMHIEKRTLVRNADYGLTIEVMSKEDQGHPGFRLQLNFTAEDIIQDLYKARLGSSLVTAAGPSQMHAGIYDVSIHLHDLWAPLHSDDRLLARRRFTVLCCPVPEWDYLKKLVMKELGSRGIVAWQDADVSLVQLHDVSGGGGSKTYKVSAPGSVVALRIFSEDGKAEHNPKKHKKTRASEAAIPQQTPCNPLQLTATHSLQPTATHFTGTGHPWERTRYMGVLTACWPFPSSSPHPESAAISWHHTGP